MGASMSDWDKLMDPARNALEALIASGDEMADRIEELEAKLEKAVEGERERCAKIADKCQRENGPLSKKGFNEQYRRGLEAAGQAIAAAIRAELTGEKP